MATCSEKSTPARKRPKITRKIKFGCCSYKFVPDSTSCIKWKLYIGIWSPRMSSSIRIDRLRWAIWMFPRLGNFVWRKLELPIMPVQKFGRIFPMILNLIFGRLVVCSIKSSISILHSQAKIWKISIRMSLMETSSLYQQVIRII